MVARRGPLRDLEAGTPGASRPGAHATGRLYEAEHLARTSGRRAGTGRTLDLAVAAAAACGVGVRLGAVWSAPGLSVWAAGLALLACRDLRSRVLPTRLVYGALLGTIAGLSLAAGVSDGWTRLGAAALAGVVAEALFASWALVRPGTLGFGDVRLAGLVGVGVGWVAPELVAVALVTALAAAAVVGVTGAALGRWSWRARLPLGTFLAVAGIATMAVAGR